jgi:flagellar motility protein MotE (MotC chaperone)
MISTENQTLTAQQLLRWQNLHDRVFRGETLPPDERAFYDTVRRQWDSEEEAANDKHHQSLQVLQERLQTLEAEYAELHARYEARNTFSATDFPMR